MDIDTTTNIWRPDNENTILTPLNICNYTSHRVLTDIQNY